MRHLGLVSPRLPFWEKESLGHLILDLLAKETSWYAAVDFVGTEAWTMLEPRVKERLGKGARVEFLLGESEGNEEKSALSALWRLSRQSDLACYCLAGAVGPARGSCRPGVHLFLYGEGATAIVGVPELTRSTLAQNRARYLVLQGMPDDALLAEAIALYRHIKSALPWRGLHPRWFYLPAGVSSPKNHSLFSYPFRVK